MKNNNNTYVGSRMSVRLFSACTNKSLFLTSRKDKKEYGFSPDLFWKNPNLPEVRVYEVYPVMDYGDYWDGFKLVCEDSELQMLLAVLHSKGWKI